MRKLWPIMLLLLAACKQKEYNADLLIKNAVVYTVDSSFSKANAFVVKGGKIIAVGDIDSLEDKYLAREVVDAQGKTVYPGFIDAHTHFYEYG
ncbi:MAG: amidohydrolase family protein, partial [Bacteroidota bacterium]